MIDAVDNLPQQLQAVLAKRRGKSTRQLAPALAYGRHRGPAPHDRRQAAVMAAIYRDASCWKLAMTLRPQSLAAHPNQVCFPGGEMDPGETPRQTALREFEEELGAAAGAATILGQLSPVYVYVSNFQVTPFVAYFPQRPTFLPNPMEVAEVVEPSLDMLLDQLNYGRRKIVRGPLRFAAPCVQCGTQQVWGATAIMLAEFVDCLKVVVGG